MSTFNRPYIDAVSRVDPTPGAWPGARLWIPVSPPITLHAPSQVSARSDLQVITYVRYRTVWPDGSVSWCWVEEP